MNEITTSHPLSADTLAHVLGTGDLSKLTTLQRVEYLVSTCKSLGLNPLTRPFRFLALNGQIQLYATKDCTDQLRSVRGITLHLVDKQIESDLYIVTARARSKDGREDEDIGAVLLPRSGESRANALMKGTTKAKRRVTLSICGLGGILDESELDTVPGAVMFDAEDELPVAPIRDAREQINDAVPLKAAAAATPRAPRVTEPPPGSTPRRTIGQLLDGIGMALKNATSRVEVDRILDAEDVLKLRANVAADSPAILRLDDMRDEALERFPPISDEDDELPGIKGEANVMAGDD